MGGQTILLTVDVEDWFQVENFKQTIDFSDWEGCEWRFEKGTRVLLDLFAQCKVSATFFILGWNAERAPDLVREIQDRGHEVASHGFHHDLCSNLGQDDLLSDLKRTKEVLEHICGSSVQGYRAPSFSISDNVITALKQLGYQYDSSFDSSGLNSRHGKLDLSDFRKTGFAYTDPDGFSEIPVSNLQWGNSIIPWGGGGYFRLFPASIFNWGVRNILKANNGYVFYTHPWEFDPQQPRVNKASLSNRFRHYVNLGRTEQKLHSLIKSFDQENFMSCKDYLLSLSTVGSVVSPPNPIMSGDAVSKLSKPNESVETPSS